MTLIVNLHSLALFNLADHISRNTNDFGILLGTQNETSENTVLSINTSFELLITPPQQDSNNSNLIDLTYLQKRYEQFKTVLPQYNIVGLYQINRSEPNSQTVAILKQLELFLAPADVFVTLLYNDEKSFKVYNYANGALDTTQKIPLQILANDEIEKISTFTISNHAQYTGNSTAANITAQPPAAQLNEHYSTLSGSIDQLELRVSRILDYLRENQTPRDEHDIANFAKIQNLITVLANKVATLHDHNNSTTSHREGKDSDIIQEQLIASKLSLLNSQVTSLESLRVNISRQIVRMGIFSQHYAKQPQYSNRQGDPDIPGFSFSK